MRIIFLLITFSTSRKRPTVVMQSSSIKELQLHIEKEILEIQAKLNYSLSSTITISVDWSFLETPEFASQKALFSLSSLSNLPNAIQQGCFATQFRLTIFQLRLTHCTVWYHGFDMRKRRKQYFFKK